MKKKYKTILWALIVQVFIYSNIFAQINITEFPENLQLFVRKENNICNVKVAGNTSDTTFDFITLRLTRNDSLSLEAVSSAQIFNFEIPIKAELAEYSFELFSHKNNQLTRIKKADKVLCGDVILLYGQSNIVAGSGVEDFNATKSDKFMRNYDFSTSLDTTTTGWYTAKYPFGGVGTIGNYLMLNLIDSLEIPFLTINPSVGGAQLRLLAERNPGNPFDKKTYYGKMLTRLKNGKVIDKVRYMAFYHGEAAAGVWYVNCNEYPGLFDTLVYNLRNDLKNLKKIYEFQINIISLQNNYVERAGFVRDFQRRTKEVYPGLIEIISTVGTEPYDGVHYGKDAYIGKAYELSRLIHRDFYGKTAIDGIEHPNLQYAFYNQNKDSITLVFQQRQKMIYPSPLVFENYTRFMENYFYMTNDNTNIYYNQHYAPVNGASSDNSNIIRLKLTGPQNFKYLTYLPATFSDSYSVTYNGPHLKNHNNLNAFSFYCVPVLDAPPVITPTPNTPENLVTTGISNNQINISWRDNSSNEDYFVLESSSDSLTFNVLYQGANLSYQDINKEKNKKYFYRIKSCNSTNCSSYSPVSVAYTYNTINYNCLNFRYEGVLKNLRKVILGKKILSGATHILNKIDLAAGEMIFLTPGFQFSADNQSTFKAVIEGCVD